MASGAIRRGNPLRTLGAAEGSSERDAPFPGVGPGSSGAGRRGGLPHPAAIHCLALASRCMTVLRARARCRHVPPARTRSGRPRVAIQGGPPREESSRPGPSQPPPGRGRAGVAATAPRAPRPIPCRSHRQRGGLRSRAGPLREEASPRQPWGGLCAACLRRKASLVRASPPPSPGEAPRSPKAAHSERCCWRRGPCMRRPQAGRPKAPREATPVVSLASFQKRM